VVVLDDKEIHGGVVWSGRRGTRVRVIKGEAGRCYYVELEAWLPWAASVSMEKETRRGAGSLPRSEGEQGGARGDGTGRGRTGRLRGSSPKIRPPGVRCIVGSQSTVKRGHEEGDKEKGACQNDRGLREGAVGALARSNMMVWKNYDMPSMSMTKRERGRELGLC
jgi:hypothetical protein